MAGYCTVEEMVLGSLDLTVARDNWFSLPRPLNVMEELRTDPWMDSDPRAEGEGRGRALAGYHGG